MTAKAEGRHEQDKPGPPRYFHGTSSDVLAQVRKSGGVCRPYVTDDLDRAEYYAEAAADEDGSDPVVLELHALDPACLRYDRAAMDEPVLTDPDDRDRAWEQVEAAHPEWSVGGLLHVPEEAWRVSWSGVGSARYDGTVTAFTVQS